MKIFNVLLAAACFSSLAFAGEFSNYTDAQKTALMNGLRGSLATKCVDDYSARAAQNKHTLSEQETKSVLEGCICITDKSIEKVGGESFIFTSDQNTIVHKLRDIMSDKDQMMPIIKECAPKKANSVN